MSLASPDRLFIHLTAVILCVDQCGPKVLVLRQGQEGLGIYGLPSGAFSPGEHRTMEIGLRRFVKGQADLSLGYVEQLYTFADRGRAFETDSMDQHIVSIGYLALSASSELNRDDTSYVNLYDIFPWEDWREGKPTILEDDIIPYLEQWAKGAEGQTTPSRPIGRRDRLRLCFGLYGAEWDEERVLERYELLYEAGFVSEARRDRANSHWPALNVSAQGLMMIHDHRRILATALSRLRAKIKYRPLIFELLPDQFTLHFLQQNIEAIQGRLVHKQNFRRLVEKQGLVEEVGTKTHTTGGRPAKLFQFRKDVLLERPSIGVKLPPAAKH